MKRVILRSREFDDSPCGTVSFEADNEYADAFATAYHDCGVTGVRARAGGTDRDHRIDGRARTGTPCGHREACLQGGSENRVELVEGPTSDLDLEKCLSHGMCQSLRVVLGRMTGRPDAALECSTLGVRGSPQGGSGEGRSW